MSGQLLPQNLKVYRIGDPGGLYPIFSAEGSRLYPGRWNKITSPMIYTSSSLALSMLEKLAHSRIMPKNQHFIEATIPAGIQYEVFPINKYNDWYKDDKIVAQQYGDDWFKQKRSPILFVPSVIVREENNVLINPHHADFTKITTSLNKPIHWDERLFS